MPGSVAEETKPKRNYNRKADNKINIKKVSDLLSGRPLKVTEAAKVLDCHPQSIYKAMSRSDIIISDYNMQAIKDNEEDELAIITHHARQHLYKLLLSGKLKGIETTAILDRCFQQRRELQGKGHTSINFFTTIIQKVDNDIISVQVKTQDVVPDPVAIQQVVSDNAT